MFHDIREAELFLARHRDVACDRNHPDDFKPENRPLLFKLDGRPVGVMRLDDLGDGTGVARLVAVARTEQRRGHGREMLRMCEAIALGLGLRTLYVNAAPEALDFYDKIGWERYRWNPAELVSIAADCIQMRKRIG